MDYTAVAILVFCVLVAVNMLWLARKITNIEKMLTAIIAGGRFTMPKINDGMTMKELGVVAGKLIRYAAEAVRPKRLKNMNKVPVIPDVPNEMLRVLCRKLLQEIETSASIEDVSLTEATWITDGKWKELTGGSPQKWKDCMARLEASRIVTRRGGKNERAWAMPYKLTIVRLNQMAKG